MVVGIIGSGSIGSAVARLALKGGHKVVISNSRGPDSMAELVAQLGDLAQAGTVAAAIRDGDFVVVAIPFQARDTLFKSDLSFDDKIVVDAMNPYTDDFKVMDLGGRGSGEVVASELPGAMVVRALNTLRAQILADSGRPKGAADRLALPFAGDDHEAKRVVAAFIDSVGYDPLDVGSLKEGRKQDPGGPLYGEELTLAQATAAAAT